jgi:hypothetical protein
VRANLQLTTGDAAVLHVAYGAADGGSDIDAWDVHRPVAMVEGNTTSYTYTFPSDIGDDVAAVRFFLLEDYDIPLTKRYDYVETDGTQFVRTSFLPTGRSAVEMELSLNSVGTSVALFGTRTQSSGADSFTLFYISGSGWRFDYFTLASAVPPTAEANMDLSLRVDGSGVYLDKARIASLVAKTASYKATNPLVLFGVSTNTARQTIGYMTSAKFRSLKAWNDFEDEKSLAFDLIPTEKDGETCLYNKIDGTYLKSTAGNALGHGGEVSVVRPAVLSNTSTLTGSFGEERLMRIAAKHRDGSTKRLSGVDLAFTTGLDRKLYVAYGVSDGGGNIANWQNVRYVDAIPGSTNEYSFAVPESWGSEINAMRLFLMDKEYIHGCDAVLEGVAVTNKHVDTAFWPYAFTTIDMSILFGTVSDSQTLFEARNSNNGKSTMTLFYLGNEGWRFDYGSGSSYQHRTGISAVTGRRYAINARVYGLKVDNEDVLSLNYEGMNSAGSALTLLAISSGGSPFKGTLYSFKAKTGKTATGAVAADLDLVPCQKDEQAYLYNRVNGEFLPFSGSGTATPVGATSNGAVVEATDALSLYPHGFVLSVQ